MARVYDLVVRHFIATVSRDADWCSTKVELVVSALEDHGKFTVRGKQVRFPLMIFILLKQYLFFHSDPFIKFLLGLLNLIYLMNIHAIACFARVLSYSSPQGLRE